MVYAKHVKEELLSLIDEMVSVPWLFSKNPSSDFTRNRKLDFSLTIRFLLSMESASLRKELLEYFHFSADSPTVSAFSRQRDKIIPETLPFLLHEFNRKYGLFIILLGNYKI